MIPNETDVIPKILVPYRSQHEPKIFEKYGAGGCGVTSLAMVLGYYGHTLDGNALDQLAAQTNAYHDLDGWRHAGLINIARALGLFGGYRINYNFTTDEDLTNAREILLKEGATQVDLDKFSESFGFARRHSGYEDIKRLIRDGTPVIASMSRDYTGLDVSHLVVITGINEGRVYINDPWKGVGNDQLPRSEFEKYWTQRIVVIYPDGK